ncbi:nidogen and EGF-like domain-containing 1 [Brachionus plicatilis]|uniref:Nidogen and EGF-like domain-containing 1 n=1 Tax=Brachionus plicatilis TaxID=10195 RepID=A0A3M7Q7V3_BRAPC|nr:nidogen and EGF-like domain-containing 1 [Brachionus plicatilis]
MLSKISFKVFLLYTLCNKIVADFIPYGHGNGDYEFPLRDDYTLLISPNYPFKFFNKSYSSLYLSSNGIVSFDKAASHLPSSFPRESPVAIAPFWADINIIKSGQIFYRQVLSGSNLEKIGIEIRQGLSVSFYPRWAFVVTWFEVAPYQNFANLPKNTFQLVLTNDFLNSFAILNYKTLEWEGNFSAGINAVNSILVFLYSLFDSKKKIVDSSRSLYTFSFILGI